MSVSCITLLMLLNPGCCCTYNTLQGYDKMDTALFDENFSQTIQTTKSKWTSRDAPRMTKEQVNFATKFQHAKRFANFVKYSVSAQYGFYTLVIHTYIVMQKTALTCFLP